MHDLEPAPSPDPESTIKRLYAWAFATITYAMCVHAADKGKPVSRKGLTDGVGAEAKSVAKDLLEKSLADCDDPNDPSAICTALARNVLDWTQRLRS